MTAQNQAAGIPPPAAYPSLAEFECGQIDPEHFNHAAHVYVAWQLLNQGSPNEAILRFTTALRRLTKALNIESKYHETISWFFMILIAERQAMHQSASWDDFAAANADLLGGGKALLERHYSDERLWSPLARRQFLLPDVPLDR